MYFFTQVLFKTDGTFDRSTSSYESQDSVVAKDLAEKAFHVAMSSAISKAEYNKAIMFVFDEEGTIKFKRVWERA